MYFKNFINLIDDEVFMSSSEDLKEYVLRQNGIVYQGSNSRPYPKRWYFGQVSDGWIVQSVECLPCNRKSLITQLMNSIDCVNWCM